jgi:hypothetical protein
MGCRVKGCEKDEVVEDLCSLHYQRLRKGKALDAPLGGKAIPFEKRLLGRIKITEEGCWEFQGTRSRKGYGRISKNGVHVEAHRASYEHHKEKIPEGMCVCHTCDNPPCINPEHLFLGTHLENMQDAYRKGRMKIPKMEYVRSFLPPEMQVTKLTEEQITRIRNHVGDLKDVATECGIGRRYAYKIRKGEKL